MTIWRWGEHVLAIAGSVGKTGAAAMTGLAVDRMKSVVECKDARLYMDGSFRIFVQAGGIRHHTELKVLRRNGLNWEELGSTGVEVQSSKVEGVPTDTYLSPELQMTVTGKARPPLKGYPGQIQGSMAGYPDFDTTRSNNIVISTT